MRIRLANPYLAGIEGVGPRWLTGGNPQMRFPMNNDGDGDDGDDSGDGSSDDGRSDDGDADDAEDKEDKNEKDGDARQELEAVKARMKAADRRAAQAEARLKQQEDAKKDELTKATERVAELEKTNAELAERLKFADLRDAFERVEGFKWRKPVAALKLARSEGYLDEVFDDDGELDAKALTKKVTEFAKANDYLLLDKEDEDKGSAGPPPPSGSPAGSGRKPRKGAAEDAELKKRYRILNR